MAFAKGLVSLAILVATPACVHAQSNGIEAISGRADLLNAMLDVKKTNVIDIDLELTPENWQSSNVIGVKAWLMNNSNAAFCVPSVFLEKTNFSTELELREIQSGQEVDTLNYHQNRDWPNQDVKILPPGAAIMLVRDVVQASKLESGKSYSIRLRVPAFDCRVFEKGYPATERFIDSVNETQGQGTAPLMTTFSKSEVYLFDGKVNEIEH